MIFEIFLIVYIFLLFKIGQIVVKSIQAFFRGFQSNNFHILNLQQCVTTVWWLIYKISGFDT